MVLGLIMPNPKPPHLSRTYILALPAVGNRDWPIESYDTLEEALHAAQMYVNTADRGYLGATVICATDGTRWRISQQGEVY